MALEGSIHAFPLRGMARGQELQNGTQACRERSISRTLFDRGRKRYVAYSREGAHRPRKGAGPGSVPMVRVRCERAILALALAWPTWGPAEPAKQLRRPGSLLARSTACWAGWRCRLARAAWRRWRPIALGRPDCSPKASDANWPRRSVAERRKSRQEKPGELVCRETFPGPSTRAGYIGKLEGAGKCWGYTACEDARWFAVAQDSPEFSPGSAARFLSRRVLPAFRATGWPSSACSWKEAGTV